MLGLYSPACQEQFYLFYLPDSLPNSQLDSRRKGRDVKETDVGVAKASAPCFILHAKNSLIEIQHLSF